MRRSVFDKWAPLWAWAYGAAFATGLAFLSAGKWQSGIGPLALGLLYTALLWRDWRARWPRIPKPAAPRPASLRTAAAPPADRPVSPEFIAELERCGASPELIAAIQGKRRGAA